MRPRCLAPHPDCGPLSHPLPPIGTSFGLTLNLHIVSNTTLNATTPSFAGRGVEIGETPDEDESQHLGERVSLYL